MKARQPFLPLGFGCIHWETLSPEVRDEGAGAVDPAAGRASAAPGWFAGGGRGLVIPAKITPKHLKPTAYIYIRQSSLTQVHENLESQRRQYELADRARTLGWCRVEVVDEDLGRSRIGAGRASRVPSAGVRGLP